MDIETKSASLDTLSVTIQALHVNGKQMTLSVFRQLPETHALTEDDEGDDGSLRDGVSYWGTVKYDFKKSGHDWVVMSIDNKLYRAPLTCYVFGKKDSLEWVIVTIENKIRRSYSDNEKEQLKKLLAEAKSNMEKIITDCNKAFFSLSKLKKLPQLFIAV